MVTTHMLSSFFSVCFCMFKILHKQSFFKQDNRWQELWNSSDLRWLHIITIVKLDSLYNLWVPGEAVLILHLVLHTVGAELIYWRTYESPCLWQNSLGIHFKNSPGSLIQNRNNQPNTCTSWGWTRSRESGWGQKNKTWDQLKIGNLWLRTSSTTYELSWFFIFNLR